MTSEESEAAGSDAAFDRIMESIGNDGPFQRRYNLIFNVIAVLFFAMCVVNVLLVLAVPEHRCSIPAMVNGTHNETEDERWKERVYPMEFNSRGEYVPNSCLMYNLSFDEDTAYTAPTNETVPCLYGYDYDRTYYDRTPITEQDWVCERELYGTNVFAIVRVSEDANRAALSLWQLVGWTAGVCLAPLILWWMRDWSWFMIVTSLPCLVFYCFPRYAIESPRWLASQGRYGACLAQLRKIATVNGRPFEMTEEQLKLLVPRPEHEKTYGIASLFSGWHMTKLTCLLLLSWICNTIPTFTLFLLSLQMGGNPFLNNFWQGAVELPAYLLGQLCCDRLGRRFTNSGAFLAATIACLPVVLLIHRPGTELYVTMLAIVVKFFVCITYFALYLQSVELYPTSLRQTGTSFGIIISNVFGAVGPYIVYLGTSRDLRLPFVAMGLIMLVGALSAIFLPETLHQKLPETMDEGRQFGRDQRFWSIPKRPSPADTSNRATIETELHELQKLHKPDS
uniref:Major facilitator superfamily (MFS) profile domain-containing protein n=1 Tax=Anopheles maculatus TaxID=74869 RepID=A0A182SHX8_9DIPT